MMTPRGPALAKPVQPVLPVQIFSAVSFFIYFLHCHVRLSGPVPEKNLVKRLCKNLFSIFGVLKCEKNKNREEKEEKSVKLKKCVRPCLRQNDTDIFSVCFPVDNLYTIFLILCDRSRKNFEIFQT